MLFYSIFTATDQASIFPSFISLDIATLSMFLNILFAFPITCMIYLSCLTLYVITCPWRVKFATFSVICPLNCTLIDSLIFPLLIIIVLILTLNLKLFTNKQAATNLTLYNCVMGLLLF